MPIWRSTTLLASLVLLSSGCNKPCEVLSKEICECEENELQQQTCINSVDQQIRFAASEPSEEEQQACEDILDSGSCTCDALAQGDWFACGLSSEPVLPEGD